jgi:hypothetical protein
LTIRKAFLTFRNMPSNTSVSPDQKAAMIRAGTWALFVTKRDRLKSEGIKPADARRQCLAEFLPQGGATTPDTSGPAPKQPSVGNKAAAIETALYEAEKATKVFGDDGRELKAPGDIIGDAEKAQWSEAVASVAATLPPIDPKFEGGVSVEAQVLWVMDNIDNPNITGLKDAPCPAAWTLLSLCRKSMDFQEKFVLALYTRMLPKDIGKKDPDDGKFDGSELVDRLRDVQQISERAKEPSLREVRGPGGAHNAALVGSTPTPATISEDA